MALRAFNLDAEKNAGRVAGQLLGLEIKGRVKQARPLCAAPVATSRSATSWS